MRVCDDATLACPATAVARRFAKPIVILRKTKCGPPIGRNEVVINAVASLGDKLVSGSADAETRVVRKSATREGSIPHDVLDSTRAVWIAALARRVESPVGAPQDIEWAIERGTPYLQQTQSGAK